jgi:eukaryotic-like serine/threonine-protein kinase
MAELHGHCGLDFAFGAAKLRSNRFKPMRSSMVAPSPPHPPAQAVRHLGRFQLLRLLGKSARTMSWLVADPRAGQEMVLLLPRSQPADAAALERWLDAARRAARIDHPGLQAVVDVGVHERWPYIAYDRGNTVTLAERLGSKGLPAAELVPWMLQVLQGLAFAHEAGLAHHDVQAGMLALTDSGSCTLMGLGLVLPPEAEAGGLQAQRRAAERDVLSLGLVLHHALAGTPPLELADTATVIERMPPLGREIVRLPWTGAHAIPEPLRAIVNRATDRQERQRYRNARTLERALHGWLRTDGEAGGGPIMLLLDRMRAAGLLPAMPGGASRAARLATLDREGSAELADIVIQDVGLAFELLRNVNGAAQRSAIGGGNGPILTIRRAIEMLGIDGVRRATAALRPWPGPLNEAQAAQLSALLDQVRLAGRVAQWLRPAGYDPELVYLLAMLQSLGRLAVQYHFPEEATQIRRLMQPAPPARAGEPEDPGMGEEVASFAVLGVDIDALGAAVARHWGLDDAVVHMMRRVPWAAPVHQPDSDDDLLRLTASCANEVVDSRSVPAHHRLAWLQRVLQRYGRVLGLSLRDLQLAAQGISPNDDPADAAPGTEAHAAAGPAPRAGVQAGTSP